MTEKRSFTFVGAGTILTIFTVLCLTVFALLCLTTALSSRNLSEGSAEALTAYAEADCAAEEVLSRLRMGETLNLAAEENGVFSYQIPISETQTLCVAVRIQGEHYEILRWQSVPSGAWQPNEDLELWDGTTPQ